MNLNDLKEPFAPEKIHWRVGATNGDKTQGIALAYIDARDVMERLDKVCGHDWQNRYPFPGCCEIGIKVDGEWLWRSNGAGETAVEGAKGQYSDAFKRAAVLWGVGQYLYDLPNTWVPLKARGRSYVIQQPPKLPQWAIPKAVQGLPQGAGVDTAVDTEKMTDILTQFRDVVDECDDDPEEGHRRAREVYDPLNQAERMFVGGQLSKIKPKGVRRSYWTCLKVHLEYAKEV